MSKVLMLSHHAVQIDRRIVAEANALAQSGRSVTLVSVPADIPRTLLYDRVRLIVPMPTTADRVRSASRRLLSLMPSAANTALRVAWSFISTKARSSLDEFFLRNSPQERFDAIHCHDLPTLPSALKLREATSPGAKVVYDSHELFPYQFDSRVLQRLWRGIEKQNIPKADLVITVNESIANVLQRSYGIPKPAVIYNSFDASGSRPPIEEKEFLGHFQASPGGVRIICHGNFSWDRNLHNLVRAFGMLDSSMKLFLLGSGSEEAALRRLSQKQRSRNIFFGPWVPQNQLAGFLAHADMGIIPYLGNASLNNLYCTPNKLFEYIELGIPICASDLPELRKIVKDMRLGDTYVMDTPEKIAEGLKDCVERRERGEFEDAYFERARERLGWSRQAERLLSLYDSLGV